MSKLAIGNVVLASAIGLVAHSARAQQQQGLVNVNITDVTVQIPIGVAANICGVSANVLSDLLAQGPATCQAGTIALAQDQGGGGNGKGKQKGLINVNLTNVTAQLPVAIAADICGIAVNVLVSELAQGPVACTANGTATITP